MKRTFCLLLAIFLCLGAAVTVRADVIYEPDNVFYWDSRGECQYHNRSYFAQGPDNVAVVYQSPKSAVVVERVANGQELWVGYLYTDDSGIVWGYTEHITENWAGWVPMDYLLLKYDHLCFAEEFSDRIGEAAGTITATEGEVYFWNYPGSADQVHVPVDGDYLPEYSRVFTDDAGQEWGYVTYYMGIKNVWVCLDAPTADYPTLYAEQDPQQVTHPVMDDLTALPQIKPGGPNLSAILCAVCVIAVLSGGFLWITRKKK